MSGPSIDQTTRDIIDLLREGRSDAKIAKRLGMSPQEVRIAIDAIVRRAGLDDAGRVEELAERAGISAE